MGPDDGSASLLKYCAGELADAWCPIWCPQIY